MARRDLAKAVRKPTKSEKKTPRVVGKAVMTRLDKVRANDWNPNRMTAFLRESLKQGLETDGWLASQALLIWGTDEKGRSKNIIIDGEHRFEVARELGFKEGPMVFLSGITETQAKALTVKMNQKRGSWDEDMLASLIRGIQYDLPVPDMSLELGIPDVDLMVMLAEPPNDVFANGQAPSPPTGTVEMPSGKMEHMRMVQLFFDANSHAEFQGLIEKLSTEAKTKNVTDTVMSGLRRACSAS